MTHIFLDSPYYLFRSCICKQIMTRKDCEQHGVQYYDEWPKKDGKDQGARRTKRQPLLENLNKELESARRESDTSVEVELFDAVWDNIDSKDGVVERSDERACEPGVENFTSEST